MSDGLDNPGVFVVGGLVAETELKAMYSAWLLVRCSGSVADAATAMGVAILTIRKWASDGVLGERGPRRGRKSDEDRAGVAERARKYLDRVAGRLDRGDGGFVVEDVVSYADLRSRYFEYVHERSGRDLAATARVLGVSVRTAGRRLGIDADPVPPAGKGRGRPPGMLRPGPERERAPAKEKAPYLHQLRGRPDVPAHFSLKDRM